jgi:hypothetical protein
MIRSDFGGDNLKNPAGMSEKFFVGQKICAKIATSGVDLLRMTVFILCQLVLILFPYAAWERDTPTVS